MTKGAVNQKRLGTSGLYGYIVHIYLYIDIYSVNVIHILPSNCREYSRYNIYRVFHKECLSCKTIYLFKHYTCEIEERTNQNFRMSSILHSYSQI
jgi:hypothetical protein